MYAKPLTDADIALLEHELIFDSEFWEWRDDDAVQYISGVHDMAQKVIEKIQKGLGE